MRLMSLFAVFPAADVSLTSEKKMASQSRNQKVAPLRSPCLTITEPADEFASMCEQVNQAIEPAGVIERMYAEDVIALTWEILRWRRSKAGIINGAFLAALQGLLEQLLNRRDFDPAFDHEEAAEELARGWFANQRAKSQVATLLRKFGLDEGAIEAEAIRSRAEDLERLDRMLALAELRRSKALHCLADYRQSQADRKKLSTDQILENDEVPRLVAVGKRPD
jgi:hypothetical protein